MQAHKPFLSYTGEWEEVNEEVFNFTYAGKIQMNSAPIFIVPPIYNIKLLKPYFLMMKKVSNQLKIF